MYAQQTSVSVEKSKAEIERLLQRFGAESFMAGTQPGRAAVAFELQGRRIRFMMPLPPMEQFASRRLRGRSVRATADQQRDAWEQACRSRWRALLLAIKAKLESAASGIETFDEAFLAQIVVADGCTVGERIIPSLDNVTGSLPPLLPEGGAR